KLGSKTHFLNVPNVVGYRALEYKASSGGTIARIELTVKKNAGISVADSENGLLVKITGPADEASADPAPAPAAVAKASTKTASVKNLAVVHGKTGMEVEIVASAPVTPQAMKLSSPDRVVLDLPNTIPSAKRELSVNGSDIKTVRMAR